MQYRYSLPSDWCDLCPLPSPQVRPSGVGSGRPASRASPGPGAGGGHVEAAEQGGGVLQPVSAAGSGGGNPGAAGQDDLPAGER